MASIDVREVKGLLRVGETVDAKGNEVMTLEVLGWPVLYADPRDIRHPDPEEWEDVFGSLLARLLADLLLKNGGLEGWRKDSPTGREVYRLDGRSDG